MPLDQNVKTPVLRISSEVAAWRSSTSRRSANEVDVMEYMPAGTCRRGTKGSDRCVHCTSSSTACIQFLSEPEASTARLDGEWCVHDMERRRWADGHIKTAQQRTIMQQYGEQPRPVPYSLYQMQQPTHRRPLYQLHIIRCYTIHCVQKKSTFIFLQNS